MPGWVYHAAISHALPPLRSSSSVLPSSGFSSSSTYVLQVQPQAAAVQVEGRDCYSVACVEMKQACLQC